MSVDGKYILQGDKKTLEKDIKIIKKNHKQVTDDCIKHIDYDTIFIDMPKYTIYEEVLEKLGSFVLESIDGGQYISFKERQKLEREAERQEREILKNMPYYSKEWLSETVERVVTQTDVGKMSICRCKIENHIDENYIAKVCKENNIAYRITYHPMTLDNILLIQYKKENPL